MQKIKTAISINKTLFERVNKLADELNVSRSRLFVMAVEAFIKRYENQALLHQINRAYDDMPLAEEEEEQQKMRRYHRDLVEGEW